MHILWKGKRICTFEDEKKFFQYFHYSVKKKKTNIYIKQKHKHINALAHKNRHNITKHENTQT